MALSSLPIDRRAARIASRTAAESARFARQACRDDVYIGYSPHPFAVAIGRTSAYGRHIRRSSRTNGRPNAVYSRRCGDADTAWPRWSRRDSWKGSACCRLVSGRDHERVPAEVEEVVSCSQPAHVEDLGPHGGELSLRGGAWLDGRGRDTRSARYAGRRQRGDVELPLTVSGIDRTDRTTCGTR